MTKERFRRTENVFFRQKNASRQRKRAFGPRSAAAISQSARTAALEDAGLKNSQILSYNEHSLGVGADSKAAAYIQIKTDRGLTLCGARRGH